MKDFLIGRPSVASTRSGSQNIQLPSNLPPISAGMSTGEPPLEDLAHSLEAQVNAPSQTEPCSSEPQVEILPDAEGRVGHIVVTCRCGEKITLQCNY